MKGRRVTLSRVAAVRLLLILSFFVLLELLCGAGVIDPVTMIPPSEMVVAFVQIIVSGRFDQDIVFTTVNIAAAAMVATMAGFLAGAALHAVPRLRRTVMPLLSAYYAVPTFVFYPLLLVAFGVGRTALIVMGALFGTVAMIVNTVLGLDHVPPAVARSGQMMRIDPLRQLVLIRLPSAAPHLVTGIKLAVSYSVIGIVAGEFILATAGLGKRIAFAYNNFDNKSMYGLLLLLLIGVMIVNGAMSAWERRLHRRFGQQ